MSQPDKDLAALKEYLLSFTHGTAQHVPLSTDEVFAILENYGPPEEISSEEKEHLVKLMKETHELRLRAATKFQNHNLIHSFGELIELFCEWNNIQPSWLAHLLNLPDEQFDSVRKDRLHPEVLGKDRILNLAAMLGMAINDIVDILDKTDILLGLKSTTNLAAGHARADKSISESTRQNVMSDAMKELMLKVSEQQPQSTHSKTWELLRDQLRQGDPEGSSPTGDITACFTIRGRSERTFTASLLQLI